jgi:hypothetical protein
MMMLLKSAAAGAFVVALAVAPVAHAQTNEGGAPRASATENSTNENQSNMPTNRSGSSSAGGTTRAAPTQNSTNENASNKGVDTSAGSSASSTKGKAAPTQTDN